jgi:hypothetical protein
MGPEQSQDLKPCNLYDDDEQFMMGRGLGMPVMVRFQHATSLKNNAEYNIQKYVCLDYVPQCSKNKTQYMSCLYIKTFYIFHISDT